jgi:hypothetical protein
MGGSGQGKRGDSVNDNQASLHNMQVRLAAMEDEIEKWKLLLGAGGWQLDRRFAQQQDRIAALESNTFGTVSGTNTTTLTPKPTTWAGMEAQDDPVEAKYYAQECKEIPLNDWNRSLDALREGIASHDYQTAAACMKAALRLLNPCPF